MSTIRRQNLRAALAMAIADPGSVVERRDLDQDPPEPDLYWQARAVEHTLIEEGVLDVD